MTLPRLGKLLIDRLYAGPRVSYVYNRTKDRREVWNRCDSGDEEWVLFDGMPARVIKEDYVGPVQFVPAILGVELSRSWDTNGNPAPVAGNFVAANELGGGLLLRGLGANPDDWIAIHTGANYPVSLTVSPHLHLVVSIPNTTSLYILRGLVGAANLETGDDAAWATPDDGIWLEYDTDVDGNLRFVTRSGGVSTSTSLGAPPAGHIAINMCVNDAGDDARLVLNGTLVATHTTHLPATQLKPLAMVGSRIAAQRDLHLHDFRLIFDSGDI